jgi:hypothetical protein
MHKATIFTFKYFRITFKKFETSVQEADDVTDYFDGTFCKIANVHLFGKDSVWVIYLKPDKEL